MDATLKELNLRRSIRKFFVDGLPDVETIFDKILTPDNVGKSTEAWMCVLIEGLKPEVVSSAQMSLFLFRREDIEGNHLAEFRDSVMEILYPGSIDLYDTSETPWAKIGGIVVHVVDESSSGDVPDGTKLKWIQIALQWTAKW